MKRNTGSKRRYLRGTVGQMLVACGLAVAMLLIFSSGGCSSSSSPSTELAAGAADDTPEVPLIFTVRTDTRVGNQKILRAQGIMAQPIPVERMDEATEFCKVVALMNGYNPNQGEAIGVLHPASGRPWCFLTSEWPLNELEAEARKMIPPRKVMKYNPATRTVTFGPDAMLPT